MNNEYGLNRVQAAKYLGIKRGVLENWEKNNVDGLVYMKVEVSGRNSIYYPKAELEAFKKKHTYGNGLTRENHMKIRPQLIEDMFLYFHLDRAIKHTNLTEQEQVSIKNHVQFKLWMHHKEQMNKKIGAGLFDALENALKDMLLQTALPSNEQKALIAYLVNKLKESFIDARLLYQSSLAHDHKKQEMIHEKVAEYEANNFFKFKAFA